MPAARQGDWLPLGTLVRVPVIASVKCLRSTRAAAAPTPRPTPTSDAPENGDKGADNSGAPPVSPAPTPAASDPAAQCMLNGSSLFLIDSIASDPQFTHSVSVPDGYTNPSLAVPRPNGGELYLHLRDDPAVANTIVVPPGSATLSRNGGTAIANRTHTGDEP